MEDNLEKITINIDSYNASFIDDYEFYVDIIDDIKNCIYIKTLKTEVFTDMSVKDTSIFADGIGAEGTKTFENIEMFRGGEYIYISLNDLHRINTVSKEVVPKRFKDLNSGETGFRISYDNGNSIYVESSKDGIDKSTNTAISTAHGDDIVFKEGGKKTYEDGKTTNYEIKETYYNTLRYFDNIYINYDDAPPPDEGVKIHKQELTGTSCGPNDTNTKVLNPILPELRRFNVILWRVNELGKHVKVPIGQGKPVFRVIMSFTIYYKRKKITRV